MILDKIIKSTIKRVEQDKLRISLDEMKSLSQKSENPFTFEKALKKNVVESSSAVSFKTPLDSEKVLKKDLEVKSPFGSVKAPFDNEMALKYSKSTAGSQTFPVAFICEVKKASPSKGVLVENFPYLEIAKEYERAGASAISVLTEPEYFMGSKQYLKEIKQNSGIPVLQKDFFIDEYQIYEASAIHADAILLICSVLSVEKMKDFIKIADSLGISCLVEAHDDNEIQMAIAAGARVIGVNNRNLKTFEIDISNSIRLRKFVPDNVVFVSESGIKTFDDIEMLVANNVDAVLIGETLMKSGDITKELASLKGVTHGKKENVEISNEIEVIMKETKNEETKNEVTNKEVSDGLNIKKVNKINEDRKSNCKIEEDLISKMPFPVTEIATTSAKPVDGNSVKIKICGIKTFKEIEYVNEAKPDYIGFVFAKSKRKVDFNKAYLLKSELSKQIKTVGVFVNEDIDFIKKCCDRGIIDIVQLHGDEDEKYIRKLKKCVYKPIIKAVRIESQGDESQGDGGTGLTTIAQERSQQSKLQIEGADNKTIIANRPSSQGCEYKTNCSNRNVSHEPATSPWLVISKLIDFPLFDTYQKNSYGGTGHTFNWDCIAGYDKPFFLAGGLNIENIEAAIRTTKPFCVDVSSGVETNGVKDKQKIIDIVRRVREFK